MFIRLGDDYFNTDAIACIRPADDDGDQTIIFTTGQSAIDGGFLLDVPTEEVFTAVQHCRLVEISQMLGNENDEPEPEPEPSPEPFSDR
jgi:hypothetical protein